MLAGLAAIGGRLRGRGAHGVGQAGEISFSVQHQQVVLLVGQHVLAELGAERRRPLGDGGHTRLGLLVEPGARLDEAAMVALEYALLLQRQPKLLVILHQRVHPREQLGVLVDGHAVLGIAGRYLALDGLDLGRGVRAGQVEEYGRYAIEEPAREFERVDGVGEGRRRPVVGDGCDLFEVLGEALLDGRQEMRGAHLVEGRHLVRRRPALQQRVLAGRRFAFRLGFVGCARPLHCRLGFGRPLRFAGHVRILTSRLGRAGRTVGFVGRTRKRRAAVEPLGQALAGTGALTYRRWCLSPRAS